MKSSDNILIFTHWSFKDALVQTYTLPYVDIIRKLVSSERKIILVTAEQQHIALSKEETDDINARWKNRNMQLLPEPYKRFGIRKLIASTLNLSKLIGVIKKEEIRTIHAFCTPAGSIAYLLSKFTGADLIVDSFEPHAEAMVENGTWKKNGVAYRILFSFEKKQTQKANALIATTAGMKKYALEKYGIDPKNFFVKPACVDLEKFFPAAKDSTLLKELNFGNKIVGVYAGKLGGIYFKGEIFNFIKLCYDRWRDDFRFLMLTDATKEEINREVTRTGLPEYIVVSRFVNHEEVPRYLSLGDFAINPVKPVPTKRYCTSIKDGEYWAMGLPVVISPSISDDSEIIEKENTGIVIDFSDDVALSGVMGKLETLIKNKASLTDKIRQIAIRYRSFELAKEVYKEIYN